MTPTAKRPTVKDVAVAAGVAPMTVSYAFSKPERVAESTRLRVLEAAVRLGYRPHPTARALRSGRNGQIGVVIGEHLSYAFEDPQAALFLAGVADVCVREGFGMVLIPTHGSGPERPDPSGRPGDGDVQRVLAAAVDAYVLWTTTADDPVLDAVAGSGRPAAIQGGSSHPGIIGVGPDDRSAAAAVAAAAMQTPIGGSRSDPARAGAAVPAIISFPLDHDRRPGLCRGSDLPDDLTRVPFPVTANRLAGYRDALIAHGHDWDDTPIVIVDRNQRAAGHGAARHLLDHLREPPPIVLTMSDQLALGASEVLPGEAVITGWDASPEARAAGLLTVTNPLRLQGRQCAAAALDPSVALSDIPWEVIDGRGG